MDIKDIQNLIKFVAKSGASEVKLEMEDVKITIRTGSDEKETTVIQQIPSGVQAVAPQPVVAAVPAVESKNEASAPAASKESNDEDSKYITVKSPIIGTFYRRPSPDKSNFVEVGDSIKEGDVLCVCLLYTSPSPRD